MGLGLFSASCLTGDTADPAPNPDNWILLDCYNAPHAHALKVRYPGCTNYEGVKVLVYRGPYREMERRDPHFARNGGPLARFRPDDEGWSMAKALAEYFPKEMSDDFE